MAMYAESKGVPKVSQYLAMCVQREECLGLPADIREAFKSAIKDYQDVFWY